ncbi:MAG: CoA pyrophosphatase [Deltaproteobacteria bacterium]|nr:CoA pyrophosphatase [Deltaproteobacteria bacterium]
MRDEILDHEDLPSHILELLRRRKPTLIEDREALYRHGAVLIPLFMEGEEYKILFTKRSDTLEDHRGQMSFPGGRIDEKDCSFLDAALRESEEEIGLARRNVTVLGRLDDVRTLSSNYVIHSFVGRIPHPYEFRANSAEVERIIPVPLRLFFGKEEILPVEYEGMIYRNLSYTFSGEIIWGATARIMRNFVGILRALAE